MNARNEREIARQLAEMPSAEPPAELLERIKADIPEELPVPGTRAPGGESDVVPFRLPPTWLAAAAVLVMLAGGGLLTWRLTEVVETPQQALEMSDAAPAQEAVRAPAAEGATPDRSVQAPESGEAAAPPAVAGDEPSRPVAGDEPRRPETQDRRGEADRSAAGAPRFEASVDAGHRELLDEGNASPSAGSADALGADYRPPSDEEAAAKLEQLLGELRAEGGSVAAGRASAADSDDEVGQDAELELLEGVAEEIVVTGQAPMIDSTSTTSGATFGEGQEVPTRWHPSSPSRRRSIPKPSPAPSAAPPPRQKKVPIPDPVEDEPDTALMIVPEAEPVVVDTPAERRQRLEEELSRLEDARGFRDWGVSPFITTAEDRLSTFGLDVDTGAYTVLRRYLDAGRLPPPAAVRVEEVVNWFTYSDPFAERPARPGEAFRVVAEGAPSPVGPGPSHRLLRFQVAARTVDDAERKPAMLTLVVDNSGSMEGEKLELVRTGLRHLVDNLAADDQVALVGFSDDAWLVAAHGDRAALARGIEAMKATDGTNAEAGLALGYQLAEEHYRDGWANRVILLSDGVANVGATGPRSILARVGQAARRGIELTTVGVGMGEFNDELLEQLADRGDGRYAYVDRDEESERLFVEELTGTLQTVAEEARVQVEFDPRSVERWRLLGYENRDIADERFRHDHSVDAGEVGSGQQVTALYEVELAGDLPAGRPLASLKLRWRDPDGGQFQEIEERLLAGQVAKSWGGASRDLHLAALAAELAEVLRGSPHARGMELGKLVAPAGALAAEFPADAKVAELVELIGKAAAIARQE